MDSPEVVSGGLGAAAADFGAIPVAKGAMRLIFIKSRRFIFSSVRHPSRCQLGGEV